jgi:hypothetical protein
MQDVSFQVNLPDRIMTVVVLVIVIVIVVMVFVIVIVIMAMGMRSISMIVRMGMLNCFTVNFYDFNFIFIGTASTSYTHNSNVSL